MALPVPNRVGHIPGRLPPLAGRCPPAGRERESNGSGRYPRRAARRNASVRVCLSVRTGVPGRGHVCAGRYLRVHLHQHVCVCVRALACVCARTRTAIRLAPSPRTHKRQRALSYRCHPADGAARRLAPHRRPLHSRSTPHPAPPASSPAGPRPPSACTGSHGPRGPQRPRGRWGW
jgi:hypothetical protein